MATYFGEVLPFVSRAIDDEDDDEEDLTPEINEKVIISSHDYKAKCNTILVAIGPIACGFCRAYLFTKETSLVNAISRKSEEENKNPEKIGEIFSINDQLDVCLISRHVNPENMFDVTEKIFSSLKDQVNVVILTVNHQSQFYTSSNAQEPPFLRCLKSSKCFETVLCPVLEPPNTINGLPAAVLTLSEVRRMAAALFVLYADVTDVDSMNTEAFLPVLNLPIFHNVKINSNAKTQLKEISSKTTVSNLYV